MHLKGRNTEVVMNELTLGLSTLFFMFGLPFIGETLMNSGLFMQKGFEKTPKYDKIHRRY